MVKIVCARYNEEVYWLIPMINHIIVYNRAPHHDLHYISKDKIITCEILKSNYETYIKHIIDNYDNLDDYTIFVQGNPEVTIFPNSKGESYATIWKTLVQNKFYDFKYISRQIDTLLINDSKMFVVSKERILRHSKEFWIEMFNTIRQNNDELENIWTDLLDK